MGLSCRFSLKPIHWESPNFPFKDTVPLRETDPDLGLAAGEAAALLNELTFDEETTFFWTTVTIKLWSVYGWFMDVYACFSNMIYMIWDLDRIGFYMILLVSIRSQVATRKKTFTFRNMWGQKFWFPLVVPFNQSITWCIPNIAIHFPNIGLDMRGCQRTGYHCDAVACITMQYYNMYCFLMLLDARWFYSVSCPTMSHLP